MRFIYLNIFMVFFLSTAQAEPVCVTTCQTFATCTRCLETCNHCLSTSVADPAVTNLVVNKLPVEFNYSKDDPNPSNATCTSTQCGTKTCTGTTTDSNKSLPASWATGACTMTPSNSMPAQISCRYKDFYCAPYCSSFESYQCCTEYKTTCEEPST